MDFWVELSCSLGLRREHMKRIFHSPYAAGATKSRQCQIHVRTGGLSCFVYIKFQSAHSEAGGGDRKCPGGPGAGTERGQSSMVKAEVKMMDKYKIG